MFHELEVMNYNYNDWVQMAVSDRTFHHIKKVDDKTCRVYDQDDICIYTVKMPYEELVARLNGQEVPKNPEPIEVDAWGVYSGPKLIDAFVCKSYAEMFIKNATGPLKGLRLVYLKGVNNLGG